MIQSHHPLSVVLPRLSVMSLHFWAAGSFLITGMPLGLFSWCSITEISMLSPETSLNWASVMPSTSIWKA